MNENDLVKLGARVTVLQHRGVKILSGYTGKTMERIVQEAIAEYLKNNPKVSC